VRNKINEVLEKKAVIQKRKSQRKYEKKRFEEVKHKALNRVVVVVVGKKTRETKKELGGEKKTKTEQKTDYYLSI
jgi:uroporphyrinogen-III synthase